MLCRLHAVDQRGRRDVTLHHRMLCRRHVVDQRGRRDVIMYTESCARPYTVDQHGKHCELNLHDQRIRVKDDILGQKSFSSMLLSYVGVS